MEPPSIEKFLNEPDVIEKIERDRVTLIDKTGDGLKVGNGMISGLNANKYYMVLIEDAKDENDDPLDDEMGYRFVNGNGELKEDLIDINKVSGGAIRGLQNSYTYTVWAASPLTGSMTRYDISGMSKFSDPTPPTGTSVTAGAGGITVPAPADYHYLDISSVINSSNTNDIYRIPVSEEGPRGLLQIQEHAAKAGKFIQLSRAYIKTDYLFVELNDKKLESFRVLTVNINGETQEDGMVFIITYDPPDFSNMSPVIQQSSSTHDKEDGMLEFTVDNHADFNSPFRWFIDGKEDTAQTTEIFKMYFDKTANLNNLVAGDYIITVMGQNDSNNEWYSASVKITVTE